MLLTEFPIPNVGVHHKEDNVQTYIDGNLTGTGSLYIAESQLTWLSAGGEGGFCLEYPKIALHAVSRDITSFPQPCLYLQVEGKLIDDDNRSTSSSEGEGEPDEEPMSEVRFVPADNIALDGMFTALSNCQILHPDPEEVDYDENVDDEYYEGEEGVEQLTEEGQINLERFEAMLRQGQGDGPNTDEPNTNGNAEDAEHRGPEDGGQFDDADMEQ
ncbi:methylosome subunit pICln-like [Mya arenaria]|uniref:methylosome subunit pICln-like n=1 Tax=Mya arenaria TaxID=6604 RepID=UPI0022E3FD38|nr:methylosome subunit pICln-like [Mya arenaria]